MAESKLPISSQLRAPNSYYRKPLGHIMYKSSGDVSSVNSQTDAKPSREKVASKLLQKQVPYKSKVLSNQPSTSKESTKPPNTTRARTLMRRSKSVPVLANVVKKVQTSVKLPAHDNITTRDKSKVLTKRPAFTEVEAAPKPPKLKRYDFKGRYNRQVENNTVLKNKLNDVEKQLLELSNIKQSYDDLTQDYNKLKNTFENKVQEYELLLETYTTKKKDHENTCLALSQVLTENKNLENSMNVIEEKCAMFKTENANLESIKENLIKEKDEIKERELHYLETIHKHEKGKEIINPTSGKLEFVFDKVFSPSSSQCEVFEELSLLIQSVIDGYNVCIFAYGQTGSGKTYTMQGELTETGMGMIPRSIDLIFTLIEKYQQIGWSFEVEASFLEIYNETIRDLLDLNGKDNLEIMFNEGKGVTVKNLTTAGVRSAKELHCLMQQAAQNRMVAVTNYNEHSSRSHAVSKITLTGRNSETCIGYTACLNLVDLAGSESAKTSQRMDETKSINKSLSALGTVMMALQNRESHVPYRNSKLTYLLQSSLGGNSKTLMFVNIAPFDEWYSESVNALRFASNVKQIKINSKKNKTYLKSLEV
ncbi:hypothetical protein FQR65_LT07359 [Abscondita terminalis]|nr:hypothetical protein FQR65_LT07359 [Abscondita terminalis]